MRVIGHYVTCDEAGCDACFEDGGGLEQWKKDGGFEGWDEPAVIFDDTESDHPTHCHKCGDLIPHALTSEGYKYVAEAMLDFYRTGQGTASVLRAWLGEYEVESDISDAVIKAVNEFQRGETKPLPWWQPELPRG